MSPINDKIFLHSERHFRSLFHTSSLLLSPSPSLSLFHFLSLTHTHTHFHTHTHTHIKAYTHTHARAHAVYVYHTEIQSVGYLEQKLLLTP